MTLIADGQTSSGTDHRDVPLRGLPHDRWSAIEVVFWLVPAAIFFLLPNYLVLGSQILIVSLFAVSLDLILGYAGIVSLGHAAFFGIGAYTAGLLSVHGWGEPISGLAAAAIVAGAARFFPGFLIVCGGGSARLFGAARFRPFVLP